jgi:hypothetical protein
MRTLLLPIWALVTLTACAPHLDPVTPASTHSSSRSAADDLAADGFVALGQREGVTLYKREGSVGFELAAEGDLPASPERIRKILLDYPAHKSWQEHLADCRVLSQGPDWLDVYERLAVAVIDDRDYTLHVEWGADGNILWTKFKTANDRGPAPVDGVVRVHTHRGGWRLAPTVDGTGTHAVYRFQLDLESNMTDMVGTGPAEGDLVHLFAQIRGQLPNYP